MHLHLSQCLDRKIQLKSLLFGSKPRTALVNVRQIFRRPPVFHSQSSNHIKDTGKFFLAHVTISSNQIFPLQTHHRKRTMYVVYHTPHCVWFQLWLKWGRGGGELFDTDHYFRLCQKNVLKALRKPNFLYTLSLQFSFLKIIGFWASQKKQVHCKEL